MITGLNQMKCGGCGNDKFEVYQKRNLNGLMIECVQCKSVSAVYINPPTLEIGWGTDESTGILCVFPDDKKS